MSYKIPLFDLNFDKSEEEAVMDVLRSKWISTGPKTREFEDLFAEMLKARHAVALANCTVALHLAMRTLDISEGDEVICPSLTFVATVNAIRYVGATPVFADIVGPEDLNIDPEDVKRKITKKTRAIIVMHYGGFSCDMDKLMDIARKHDLKVIEDACHAPLSEFKEKKLGTIGDVGCFSFFSNKNISTGEGGMLVTNNPEINEHIKLLRSHGMTSLSYERSKGHSATYDVIELGYNYRMDDIRAAIGIVQLKKLVSDLDKRAILRQLYVEKLEEINEIIVPFKSNANFSSNYIFPVILKTEISAHRDKVRDILANRGIQTSMHYPPIHLFSIYKPFRIPLPVTEIVGKSLITLPMYSKLSEENLDFIVDSLKLSIDEFHI